MFLKKKHKRIFTAIGAIEVTLVFIGNKKS